MYHPVTGARKHFDQLKWREHTKWDTGMGNRMGWLTKGIGMCMTDGTGTMFYIKRSQVLSGKKVIYTNAICDCRPLKYDPYQV